MKLLAFELATEACSVALWNDGEVAERFELAPRRHAELALPWAEALLAEAGIARSQLDAIVRALSDEVLGAPGSVPVPEGEWHGVGTGFAAGEGALVQRLRGHSTSHLVHVDDTQLPHAADLACLAAVAFEQGGAVAADAVEPAYLRNNVALTLVEQRALRK